MDFGNLFGGMQERLKTVKQELEHARLDAESGEGRVRVVVSGSKKLQEVQLKGSFDGPEGREELEDLLVVAINRAMDKADAEAAKAMHSVTGGMIPPGMMDNLMG
jgi:DNA-binding protein YbaB